MTQSIVAKKLIVYLNSLSPIEHPEARTLAKELRGGNCFAFSVIHGALTAELVWYKSALINIATWDKNLTALDMPISLPQTTNNTAPTLGQLFNQIKDYIIQLQGRNGIRKILTHVPFGEWDCLKDLEVVRNQEIQKVKHITASTRYFSEARLIKTLSRKIANAMCLVHNDQHTIRIGYINAEWLAYDPNYSHLSEETIQKTFATKRGLAKEIFSILGQALAIQVVSFDKRIQLSNYVGENITSYLKDYALFLTARYNPEVLPNILKKLKTTVGTIENEIKNLTADDDKNRKIAVKQVELYNLLKQFVEALIKPTRLDGSTALKQIFIYHTVLIPSICELMAKLECHSIFIEQALLTQESNGKTLFDRMMALDELTREHFWALLPDTPQNRKILVKALILDRKNNLPGLYALLKHGTYIEVARGLRWIKAATNEELDLLVCDLIKTDVLTLVPESLMLHVIQLIGQMHNTRCMLLQALTSQSTDKRVLDILHEKAHGLLLTVFEWALIEPQQKQIIAILDWVLAHPIFYSAENFIDLFIKYLMVPPYNTLHKIIKIFPKIIPELIKPFNKLSNSTLVQMLSATTSAIPGFIYFAQASNLNDLHQIVKLALSAPEASQLFAVLTQYDNNTKNTTLLLLKNNALLPILHLIAEKPEGPSYISNLLTLRTVGGLPGIQFLITKEPEIVFRILKLAQQGPNGTIQVIKALAVRANLTDDSGFDRLIQSDLCHTPTIRKWLAKMVLWLPYAELTKLAKEHPQTCQAMLKFFILAPITEESIPLQEAIDSLLMAKDDAAVSINNIQAYLSEIKRVLEQDNSGAERLIDLISRLDINYNSGLYLIRKYSPGDLKTILTIIKTSVIKSDADNLSLESLKNILHHYVYFKNQRFFKKGLEHISKESLNAIAELLSIKDDTVRLYRAKQYISKYPKKTLAIELQKSQALRR